MLITAILSATIASSHAIMDLDGNGYSDIWEEKFDAKDLDPSLDQDGDGESNFSEHQSGTDPFDDQSVWTSVVTHQFLPNQMMIGLQSLSGKSYKLETSPTLLAADWVDSGTPVMGNGEPIWMSAHSDSGRSFFRVKVPASDAPLSSTFTSQILTDTDGDGVSDVGEWEMGTELFDPTSRFADPQIRTFNGVEFRWTSQVGKHYQIVSRPAGPVQEWTDLGSVRPGTGGEITAVFPLENSENLIYSVRVQDLDTDGDGLTDWEEHLLGLRPDLTHTDHLGEGDLSETVKMFDAVDRVVLSAPVAIGNVTRDLDGFFEIRRESGVNRLVIELSVSGDATPGSDYEKLSESVVFPFAQDSIKIPVRLLPDAEVSVSESVTITLQASALYEVDGDAAQTIHLITENPVNVRDYGAVGDGVTDDRVAIQNAINALENDPSKNTLYFPDGQYALDSYFADSRSGTSLNRILKLGAEELAGRDLVFAFDENASLYSIVSPIRAHILECESKFRSLSFYGAQFVKDDTVLGSPKKVEPNGADGVALVLYDLREIEMVQFLGCRFQNCHGAISSYGSGFKTRGKLKYFRVQDCEILNPWGANSIAASKIWGGGQLVNILPWVGTAEYLGNHFDGGSKVQTHPEMNPLGREKDGSQFGSPLRLIFKENLVDHMRIEAVYHGHDPLLSYTSSGLTFPELGEEVKIRFINNYGLFKAGDKIAIRGVVEGLGTRSISLTVVGYQEAHLELTVRNDGENSFAIGGVIFPDRYPVYLQGEEYAGRSIITDNVVRGFSTPQSVAFSGIVVTTKAVVARNYVEGYASGVLIYGNARTPLSPPSKGTIIENNIIYTAEGIESTVTTYGIQSFGFQDMIRDNLVIMPAMNKTVGIALRGNETIARRNDVLAEKIVRHDYADFNRLIGIGVGNSASLVRIENNTTRGFDVGVGPVGPFQGIPHYASGNRSFDDFLSQDRRGLIEEE